MLFKDDIPPTSKEEADARRVRPPPERYDPDKLSHWSITMTLAWIIRRDLDAVRNEWDDYRNECADWRFEGKASARAKVAGIAMKHISTGKLTRLPGKLARLPKRLRKDFQKGSWHFHQWESSGWDRLRLGALSENRAQVAIDSLRQAAGEGRIRAIAIECENAQTLHGNHVEIPAHHWAHLKLTDDRSTGKPMLSGPDRVYREVQFPRLDVKELWPKSPPLSAEPELPEPKVGPAPTTALKGASPQSKCAARHIARLYPDGTDGISSEVIRKKLEKDPVMLAELAEHGGKPPSRGSIDRARGLRR